MPRNTMSFCSAALEGTKPAKEPSGNLLKRGGLACAAFGRLGGCLFHRRDFYIHVYVGVIIHTVNPEAEKLVKILPITV